MDNILSLDNITLTYFSDNGETLALSDISFSIKKGEFLSIVGPSGCGKTTILSIISGLLKPTSGDIKFYDIEDTLSKTGYMFQKDHLFEWRNVLNNVYLGLEIQKKKTQENMDYVNTLLKKYGLWEFKNKYPNQLSGGMRQRVALIRTLALRPKILLLDEAFSALDYQTRLNVCDDISHILKSEGVTSVLVTHDISEAISLSDRIIVLTSRPAKVKNIHTLDLGDFTPFQKRELPEVSVYFDKIWRELQNEKS